MLNRKILLRLETQFAFLRHVVLNVIEYSISNDEYKFRVNGTTFSRDLYNLRTDIVGNLRFQTRSLLSRFHVPREHVIVTIAHYPTARRENLFSSRQFSRIADEIRTNGHRTVDLSFQSSKMVGA